MFFFGKKQTKPQLKEYSFTLTKGFRGFKRFPIVIHGHKESEKNNKALKDTDLREHTLTFTPGSGESYKDPFYQVFIDNLHIGAIFDAEQVKAINSGRIEAVYAKNEEEAVISKKSISSRNIIRLFVKYKEE